MAKNNMSYRNMPRMTHALSCTMALTLPCRRLLRNMRLMISAHLPLSLSAASLASSSSLIQWTTAPLVNGALFASLWSNRCLCILPAYKTGDSLSNCTCSTLPIYATMPPTNAIGCNII
eukprot:scaffold9846_cov36-Cyclotella_meneghiniana.AAC.2